MEKQSYEVMVNRIKDRMFHLGLNARTLAQQAKVGKSFIYDVLRGKSTNPTSGKLIAIADVLGVSLSYLIGNSDSSVDSSELLKISIINDSVDSGNIAPLDSGVYMLKSNALYSGNFANISLCRMFGDDMYPTIEDREVVFFDSSQDSIAASGVFVISDQHRTTIRRIECNIVDSSKIRIIPDNEKYSYSECSISDIKILGRVIMKVSLL